MPAGVAPPELIEASKPYHFGPNCILRRCGAKAKSTGLPCRKVALSGKTRCNLHGGYGGRAHRRDYTKRPLTPRQFRALEIRLARAGKRREFEEAIATYVLLSDEVTADEAQQGLKKQATRDLLPIFKGHPDLTQGQRALLLLSRMRVIAGLASTIDWLGILKKVGVR